MKRDLANVKHDFQGIDADIDSEKRVLSCVKTRDGRRRRQRHREQNKPQQSRAEQKMRD